MYIDFSRVKDYSDLTPEEKIICKEEYYENQIQCREEDQKDIISDSNYNENDDIEFNVIEAIEPITNTNAIWPDDIRVVLTTLNNVLNGMSNN